MSNHYIKKKPAVRYPFKMGWTSKHYLTLFTSITMLRGTHNIMQSIPHISHKIVTNEPVECV